MCIQVLLNWFIQCESLHGGIDDPTLATRCAAEGRHVQEDFLFLSPSCRPCLGVIGNDINDLFLASLYNKQAGAC